MTADDLRRAVIDAAELALVAAILGQKTIEAFVAVFAKPGPQRRDVVSQAKNIRACQPMG